jgi:penicillin amidase
LEPKNNWDVSDVKNMITDNTSAVAPSLVANWLQLIEKSTLNPNEKIAIEALKNWKGTNELNEIAPTIYNKWVYCYLKNTFQDELGADNFNAFLGTHIMKQVIASQSQNNTSVWWDDLKTKAKKETQKDIMNQSFKDAILSLQKQLGQEPSSWTWNKVHTVEYQHAMGKVKALKGFFNVGPFAINGSNEVINNLMFTFNDKGEYEVKAGPSTRRVIDFSDIENSWSVLPTGQSGNPMSSHYNDQAKMYAEGKFRKMLLNKVEIQKNSTKLVFIKNKE